MPDDEELGAARMLRSYRASLSLPMPHKPGDDR